MLQEIAPMALSDSELLGDFHFNTYVYEVPSGLFTFVIVAITHTAYLSLGSNQGNSFQILTQATADIGENCGEVFAVSKMYRTAAWGMEEQPDFLNMVLGISTAQVPLSLLNAIQEIEHQHQRIRTTKWGKRTLDIDILYYDDLVLDMPDLVVPHPYLHERGFVLAPLAKVAPYFVHPILKLTTQQLLDKCEDKLAVVEI